MPPFDDDTKEFAIPSFAHDTSPIPDTKLQVQVAGRTHAGWVRENNEDHFLVVRFGRFLESLHTNLSPDQIPLPFSEEGYGMVVADGLGGHVAGEHASRMAITTLLELVLTTPDWILRGDEQSLADEILQRASDRFEHVHHALADEAAVNPQLRGFGTTMTLAASVGRDLFIANIGDSRAYLLRQGKLLQLTRDHTFATELQEAGVFTAAQAAANRLRHVLTRSLGSTKASAPDVQKLTLANGDRLLLCSDGLNEMIDDNGIATILAEATTPELVCDRLINAALEAGGKDNVTVIVARYDDAGQIPSD